MQQLQEQAALTNQLGKTDPIVQLMQKYGIKMTRENYLYYAYMGDVPKEIGAEIEESMPEQFRLKDGTTT